MANENPQEFLHKTWVSSALLLGWNIQPVVNVPAYAQTLPEK